MTYEQVYKYLLIRTYIMILPGSYHFIDRVIAMISEIENNPKQLMSCMLCSKPTGRHDIVINYPSHSIRTWYGYQVTS